MSPTFKFILYVGGFELPDKNAAAQRVLGNAKALRDLGYTVVFLDVNKEVPSGKLSDPHDTEGFLTYSQCHETSFSGLLKYCCNPCHVEEILQKHDDWHAVIAYNYPALALWKLRKICRMRGIKLYGDCTEWHTLGRFNLKYLFIQFDMFFRLRFVQKKLDGMIVISRYLENYYKKHTKTVVLPPLVDIHDAKWDRSNVKPHTGLRLVYFGSPGPHKDKMEEIFAVVRQIPSRVMLQIVGLTQEQYVIDHPSEAGVIAGMNAQGKLKFFGRLPHREALEIVKNSDFSIFYRKRDRTSMAGFPTKFVESISCGVPVVTTDTSDLREYVQDKKNALLLSEQYFGIELSKYIQSIIDCKDATIWVEKVCFNYQNYLYDVMNFLATR